MVTDTTMVNNRMECREIQSTFLCFHQRYLRKSLFWRKAVYQQCGGTYKGLCKQNVSGVVDWRYSIGEDG